MTNERKNWGRANSRVVSFFEKYLSFHKKNGGGGGGQAPQLPMGYAYAYVIIVVEMIVDERATGIQVNCILHNKLRKYTCARTSTVY